MGLVYKPTKISYYHFKDYGDKKKYLLRKNKPLKKITVIFKDTVIFTVLKTHGDKKKVFASKK